MAYENSKTKCFTFTWKLENASYCFQRMGEKIESPAFELFDLQDTKWTLWLYPRGDDHKNYVGLYLNREEDSKGAWSIKIRYELAFLAKDGSVLASSGAVDAFSKGKAMGYDKFVNRKEVFITKRTLFLPQDTLTACCRIWKTIGELSEDVRCIARTHIRIEKRSFLWNIKNFATLESEKISTYLIKSLEDGRQLMSVKLTTIIGVCCEEMIRFELVLCDETIEFSTVLLFLVDALGSNVQCNQDEFWFENLNDNNKELSFLFTKQQLIAKKSLYLPNDVLSLHWYLIFSEGIAFEEIEEVLQGSTTSESEIYGIQYENTENVEPLLHTTNDSLKSLYDEKSFCDITLKTSTGMFPAHKVILSAFSSVFKAMFLSDMKEKNNNCVNIEDLDDDTIRRMLLYIYTARVGDLAWESASNLYAAADKYAILNLKNVCSSYMKDHLSPSNACEALLLSDLHTDADFKSAVQDCISKHGKQVTRSDEWKALIQTNAKLAAETLSLLVE